MITVGVRIKDGWFLLIFLKVEPTGFPDRQEGECARKRGLKDDFKFFGLSKWKDGVAINWDGDDVGDTGWSSEDPEFHFGPYFMGLLRRQLNVWTWSSEERSDWREKFGSPQYRCYTKPWAGWGNLGSECRHFTPLLWSGVTREPFPQEILWGWKGMMNVRCLAWQLEVPCAWYLVITDGHREDQGGRVTVGSRDLGKGRLHIDY